MHRITRSLLVPGVVAAIAGCARPPVPPPVAAAAGESKPIELLIAATTDVHGRLVGWDYYANQRDTLRGLSYAATIVDSLRAVNPGRVVLVDAGDLLQGNPLTYVAARKRKFAAHPVIAAMNAMQYDAAAIGNHEFNYGVPFLDSAIADAAFPFLAANAERLDGGKPFAAMRMIERSGVKIAIVGATTPGSMVWDRDHLRDRVRIGDIIPAVDRAARSARDAGAEVVIVAVHSGLREPSSYDTAATGLPSENVSARIAREVAGIDLIVFGHSHREVADTTIGSTLLMQPRNWATSVGVATLTVDGAAGARKVVGKRGQVIAARGHAEHPAVVSAVEAAHRATVAYATSEIGTTPVVWHADSARVHDMAITDFVLEVMRRNAKADLAASAAFSLRGGFDAGPITVAEIARLYPYDNTLRAVRVTGKQLRDFLEHSARYYRVPADTGRITDPQVPGYNFDIIAGAEYVLDIRRPPGQRITRLRVRNRDVADADTFTLAVNNYRQTGGGGFSMLASAPVVYDRQQDIRELLITEVDARDVLRPSDYHTHNWRLEPDALHGRLMAEMLGDPFERGAAPPVSVASGGTAAPGGSRLRIIATNDMHGALEPRPDSRGVMRGGLAHLAGLVDSAARACPSPCEVLLIDAGDMFQGTPASNFLFGKPVVDAMNRMGYAAAALGNHEFDWGQDTLRSRMRDARFSVLGANVRDSSGRDVTWIPNDTIVRRGRLTIGIIGASEERTPQLTKAGNTNGLRFDPPAPIVDSIAKSLRARGANVVIVTAHIGASCDRTGANECRGEIVDLINALNEPVDAVVSGHTHSLVDAVIRGIPVVQAYSRTTAIAVLDLVVPIAPEDRGRVISVTPATKASPAVDSIVRVAVRRVAPIVDRPAGEFAAAMGREGDQFPLGNVIADAQRWAAEADIGLMNNGGIRAGVQAGTATYGSLYEVQPFGNVLMVADVTGAGILRYLERVLHDNRVDVHISGMTVRYDSTRPAGSRVISVQLGDGRPLDPNRRYRVSLSDFMALGGDQRGFGRDALSLRNTNIVDVDAMVGYLLRQEKPLQPPAERRFIDVSK